MLRARLLLLLLLLKLIVISAVLVVIDLVELARLLGIGSVLIVTLLPVGGVSVSLAILLVLRVSVLLIGLARLERRRIGVESRCLRMEVAGIVATQVHVLRLPGEFILPGIGGLVGHFAKQDTRTKPFLN